jgi:apolipoprotein N-acyltransferase
VVDPYGRIRESLPAGTSAVLSTQVAPVAVRTPYVVLGDFFAFLCALLALTALAAGRRVTEQQAVRATAWIPKPAA